MAGAASVRSLTARMLNTSLSEPSDGECEVPIPRSPGRVMRLGKDAASIASIDSDDMPASEMLDFVDEGVYMAEDDERRVDFLSCLPFEISVYILLFADVQSICRAKAVSKTWHTVCSGAGCSHGSECLKLTALSCQTALSGGTSSSATEAGGSGQIFCAPCRTRKTWRRRIRTHSPDALLPSRPVQTASTVYILLRLPKPRPVPSLTGLRLDQRLDARTPSARRHIRRPA
jgi:hypothetical protein